MTIFTRCEIGRNFLLNVGIVALLSVRGLNAQTSNAPPGGYPPISPATTQRSHAMRPRLYDPRISYYDAVAPTRGNPDATPVRYIQRWHLEKKDPSASVSDVIRPLVYRIDSTVPEKWVPWIQKGIEAWKPVLESAGFRDAIIVRTTSQSHKATAADLMHDPFAADSMAELARASILAEIPVIWIHDTISQAETSFHANHDTGEMTQCVIRFYDGTVNQQIAQHFASTAAVDSRARFPYPDSLIGRILEFVAMHETGHSLGLDHNYKAGAAYPTDSLRSPSFIRRMGHASSVMAYSSYNNIAQPEDNLPPNDLINRIGPYDRFAIAWGYTPIPEAKTPEEELPILERWRAVQDTVPHLRASIPSLSSGANGLQHPIDPTDRAEIHGNDPLRSAQYGILNLARIAEQIPQYGNVLVGSLTPRTMVLFQWRSVLMSVVDMVGGRIPMAPYDRDIDKTQSRSVDSIQQIQAVRFVLSHLVRGEDELLRKYLLSQKERARVPHLVVIDTTMPGWNPTGWRYVRNELLDRLLEPDRLHRLAEQARDPLIGTSVVRTLCHELQTLGTELSTSTSVETTRAHELHDRLTTPLVVRELCRSYWDIEN